MAEIKDLKEMTVRALQEKARSLLGAGYEKLKTRSQLIDAILAATRQDRKAGAPAAEAPGGGTVPEEGVRPRQGAAQPGDRGDPAKAQEPRPEGFLVTRVAGEDAARTAPIPLTEDRLEETIETIDVAAKAAAAVWDEGLGELPGGYGDDALVALPRDPETLWLYWDYAHPTVQEAMKGLKHPHAKLRIFEQGKLVREIDFALESRSFYVTGLAPGRHYRAEVFFVGTEGGEHRLGKPSNAAGLPPRGPSSILDDRFVTLAWGTQLTRRNLFAKAEPDQGFPDTDRSALSLASRGGGPLGASEKASANQRGHSPGGPSSGSAWSGSRYEESR